jgi:hypothetical protein
MKKLEIESTKDTLGICFDPILHTLEFRGVSYPSNPITFFQPLIDWVEIYLHTIEKTKVTLHFYISYFNTSSSAYLFRILELFDNAHKMYGNVNIFWHNETEDDDALDSWKSLMNDLDLPFKLVKNESKQ